MKKIIILLLLGLQVTQLHAQRTTVFFSNELEITDKNLIELIKSQLLSQKHNDGEILRIEPEDVISKELGKPGWQRHAMFVLDERVEADQIYIGECWIEGGQWSSYPPHKHDDANMPTEANTEEIYYYEFDKPQGFGIQKVYTMEGDIDETYTVKSGDFVEIPRGYHPFHSAPGYKNYMLWIMAGPVRGFYMTTDEDHAWLNK